MVTVKLTTPLKIDLEDIRMRLQKHHPEFLRCRKHLFEDSSYTVDIINKSRGVILCGQAKNIGEGFINIYSNYSVEELDKMLSVLPADLLLPIVDALKGTKLALTNQKKLQKKETGL